MRVEFVLNSEQQKIALIPVDARDKTINRLAFDGNIVVSVDLRDDGALLFTLVPKESR